MFSSHRETLLPTDDVDAGVLIYAASVAHVRFVESPGNVTPRTAVTLISKIRQSMRLN